jgi:hypothetical protein
LTRPNTTGRLKQVETLSSWDQQAFEAACKKSLPVRLPATKANLSPACSKWFVHDDDASFKMLEQGGKITVPASSELLMPFWQEYVDVVVPLEVTTINNHPKALLNNTAKPGSTTFERVEAPLSLLLDHLSPTTPSSPSTNQPALSIYLAQCDLPSLPDTLTSDVPTPTLIQCSTQSPSSRIKGDIYASSLWLGRSPTYTPLHRDPNPNLFIQLAGTKIVRLLPPDVGEALYHELLAKLPAVSRSLGSSRIRGEEMMQSPQREVFHDALWDEGSAYLEKVMEKHGVETTLGMGDALFTPLGWWHSVKGVGRGVTGSVNWWFR